MSGKNTTTPAKQDGFKSQWGFIMAAVGSCVGMANVWRFPMLVSRYGGLTFLIPYFIFVIVISQSGMMEEFSLGRWAGYGPVGSFGKAMENGGKSKKAGELIGGVPVFASLCLGIGYSVIMGWVFYYAKMALTGELVAMGNDMNVIGGTFGAVAPEAASLPPAIPSAAVPPRRALTIPPPTTLPQRAPLPRRRPPSPRPPPSRRRSPRPCPSTRA